MGSIKDFKEKVRKTVEQLNVIDDVLFRKMAEDKAFCEEVISTIMEQKITILEVTEQKDIMNLQGRSVILDALCMDEYGKRYNIEVQKPDVDDHQRRVRYNSACITCNFSRKNSKFGEIPDVVIIFISRFDIFKSGKTTYHIDRVIRETGDTVDNGFKEIYVNAAVDDGSKTAKLMDIFTEISAYDFDLFPNTSKRKEQFKKSEKGAVMCELVEELSKEYAAQAVKEAKDEAIKQAKKETAKAVKEAKDEAIKQAKKETAKAVKEAKEETAKAIKEETARGVDRMTAALGLSQEEACKILGITLEQYFSYKRKPENI